VVRFPLTRVVGTDGFASESRHGRRSALNRREVVRPSELVKLSIRIARVTEVVNALVVDDLRRREIQEVVVRVSELCVERSIEARDLERVRNELYVVDPRESPLVRLLVKKLQRVSTLARNAREIDLSLDCQRDGASEPICESGLVRLARDGTEEVAVEVEFEAANRCAAAELTAGLEADLLERASINASQPLGIDSVQYTISPNLDSKTSGSSIVRPYPNAMAKTLSCVRSKRSALTELLRSRSSAFGFARPSATKRNQLGSFNEGRFK